LEALLVLGFVRFRPFLRPLVWGGRRLAHALGKELPTAEAYGESWEVSDHPSHRSAVADGPLRGRTIRDLMEQSTADLFGCATGPTVFPWLVKYLDARDWLSVQVHPDDEKARRLSPGEGGKTEAWFILDAEPDSRVYAGLRPDVDERRLRQALSAGSVAECLQHFRPQPGDCLFLPAGTVHAVGGGVLMAEVQQTSDATFRLFDWNRRDDQGRARPLHIEQALACIDWRAGPVEPVRAEGYPGSGVASQHSVQQLLVKCRYFTLEYVRRSEPFMLGGAASLQVVMVVHGRGELQADIGPIALVKGHTLVVPATLLPTPCRPDGGLGLLVATMPSRRGA
jgi:mannose-6-phosphate isomerase